MISSDEIKSFAREIGFDVVGVVSASPIRDAEEAFQEWVEDGFHGEMKYLEEYRERLARLEKQIPNAKSIIVFGVNYFTPSNGERKKEAVTGRVARYAWGKDYHHVIKERLGKVEKFIKEKSPEANCLICVDTQPIFERSYAEEAGLGFRGRHTNLLSKDFGPWLFLSEIITDLEFVPDSRKDHGNCGTCVACLEVCPTGAIVSPGKIDARKCIAYLTIEHKGVIPLEIRPLMKNWVFGCDECLNVCPFTRSSKETTWEDLRPEAGVGRDLNLHSLFEIKTNGEYEKRFKGTPLLRASRKMMLRNAAVVLGNLRDEKAVPLLAEALEREAPLVRRHVAWALGQIGGDESRKILKDRFLSEEDSDVKEEIKSALRETMVGKKS